MKLLFLTPQLPYPPRQGTTIRNYNLIRWLAPQHTIDLLTFLAPGETLREDSPLHQLCRRIATVAQPSRSTSARARDTLLKAAPDMALRLESPQMHALVQEWLAAEPYDIVQFEGIELAQYGRHTCVADHIFFAYGQDFRAAGQGAFDNFVYYAVGARFAGQG